MRFFYDLIVYFLYLLSTACGNRLREILKFVNSSFQAAKQIYFCFYIFSLIREDILFVLDSETKRESRKIIRFMVQVKKKEKKSSFFLRSVEIERQRGFFLKLRKDKLFRNCFFFLLVRVLRNLERQELQMARESLGLCKRLRLAVILCLVLIIFPVGFCSFSSSVPPFLPFLFFFALIKRFVSLFHDKEGFLSYYL